MREGEDIFHYRKHNIDLVYANIIPPVPQYRKVKCRIQRKYQTGFDIYLNYFKLL